MSLGHRTIGAYRILEPLGHGGMGVVYLAERELIRRALQETGGNRTKAAQVLGISHRALLYKLQAYGEL